MDENMLNTAPSTSKTKLIIGVLVLLVVLGGGVFVWYSKNKPENKTSTSTTNNSTGSTEANTTQPSSEETNNPNPATPATPATPDTSGTDHSNPPSTTTPPSTSTSTVPRQDTGVDTFDPGNLPPTTSTPPRPPGAQTDPSGGTLISP